MPDARHPRLKQHIEGVIQIMRFSRDWGQFMYRMGMAYPSINEMPLLPFPDDDEDLPRLCFFHRAAAAFLAISRRCCLVNLAARAAPPCFPPRRPRATAAGFFSGGADKGAGSSGCSASVCGVGSAS